jgi:NAD(P)-dependent dehydrogenase (short-subunit alcohol dehydrogenase family)
MAIKDYPKNILITGSSAGIGAEIAVKLSKAGHSVFLTGRNQERLLKLAATIKAKGFLAGCLTEEDFPEKLYNKVTKNMGNIDVLINNAGSYLWSPIEDTPKEKVSKNLKLNLEVPYNLCSLVVSSMKNNKWGRIINIGSISGAVGEANASLYSTSKSGLIGLTKSLALELAEFGITVNVVNPGWVKTELADNAIEQCEISEEEQLEMIPQKRWIEPTEIADLVEYLISDSAQGITGQSLNLCCGLSLG